MPKLKLKNEEFTMIHKILYEEILRRKEELFKLICEYLEETQEYTDEGFKEVYNSFCSNISKRMEIYSLRKKLFLMEHTDKLTDDEEQQLNEIKKAEDSSKEIKYKINGLYEEIQEIECIKKAVYDASTKRTIFDDDDYESDNGKTQEEIEMENKFWDAVMY